MRNKLEQEFKDTYEGKVLHVKIRNISPLNQDCLNMELEVLETGDVFNIKVYGDDE